MTIVEAARELGIEPQTMRAQVRAGKIRHEKHGSQYWITPAAVEEYRRTRLGKPGIKAGTRLTRKRKEEPATIEPA